MRKDIEEEDTEEDKRAVQARIIPKLRSRSGKNKDEPTEVLEKLAKQ